MTPDGDRDLGQHWLRYWLVAWRHQVITWNNVDWSSVETRETDIRAISQQMPKPSITKIGLIITCLKFHSDFPGANESPPFIFTYIFTYTYIRVRARVCKSRQTCSMIVLHWNFMHHEILHWFYYWTNLGNRNDKMMTGSTIKIQSIHFNQVMSCYLFVYYCFNMMAAYQ